MSAIQMIRLLSVVRRALLMIVAEIEELLKELRDKAESIRRQAAGE